MSSPPLAGRVPALIALGLLGMTLLIVLVVATPWRPLESPAGRPSGGGAVTEVRRDFSDAEIAREKAFHREVRPWGYLALTAGFVTTVVLGLTPLGAMLVALVARPFGGGWVARVLAGTVAVALLGAVIRLPPAARAEIVLRRYGLSTQDWWGWGIDQLKTLGITMGLLAGMLLAFYALVRAVSGWWLPVAAGGALAAVALSFLYPLVFEPVFNTFTPMPPGSLRTRLLDLAARDHVEVSDVLVADASRRTTALNAYVSGFAGTRRIVVYDTALTGASEDEVELIAAHELGHAKRADVLHGTLVGAVGLAVGVILIYLVTGVGPVLRQAGVDSVADPRSLALVLAVVTVLGALAEPVQLLVSRRIEARADVHSLELTQRPDEFVRMQRRLALTNLAELAPNPLAYGLFASHPSTPERIALARAWAAARGLPTPPDLVPGRRV